MNYSSKPIKKVFFSIALLLITLLFASNNLALASEAEGTKQEQDAGPYHVFLETQPGTIAANEAATITMIVTNKADGKAVTGAKIISQATMENSSDTGNKSSDMSGMGNNAAGMDKPVETVLREQVDMNMEPGSYMADVNFKQPGSWMQAISISSPLGQSTVNFPVNVVKSGPNFIFIGSVAGLIVLAGIIAAIIKKKKIAETGGTL